MSASFEEVKSAIDGLRAEIALEDITQATRLEDIGVHPYDARYGAVIGLEVTALDFEGTRYALGSFYVNDEDHPEYQTVGDILEDYGFPIQPQYSLIRNW
jgi:hypothetical protein